MHPERVSPKIFEAHDLSDTIRTCSQDLKLYQQYGKGEAA